MSYPIRRARPEDAGAIRACADAAYSKYIPRIGRAPAPMAADFDAQIADGFLHVAVAPDDGVLGYVCFWPEPVPEADANGPSHIQLDSIAVTPKAAGRGVGKSLLSFVETSAKEMGATAIHLYTNAAMTENLTMYPALGYTATDRRTEDGFSRVYFRKPLL